uniref:C-type lectin domain-containing protein n=1 Tax=Vombatus ursinus TaxID=29139 RepID=A0A4X2JSF8_VOMUR
MGSWDLQGFIDSRPHREARVLHSPSLFPLLGPEDPSDPPSARTSCPEGFSFFDSHYYGLIVMKRLGPLWKLLLCQDYRSGHLASLLNKVETLFVATMITESGGSLKPIWIGLYDPNENRKWRWSSSGLFLYQAWDKGALSQTNPNYCVILTQESGEKERDRKTPAILTIVKGKEDSN